MQTVKTKIPVNFYILRTIKPLTMKKAMISFFTVILFHFILLHPLMAQFIYPHTDKQPVEDTLHNMILTDNYQWLENKTDANVIAWTKAQHEATVKYINSVHAPIDGLRDEFEDYIDRDYISPLTLIADRQFFTVRKKGDKQLKLYTKIGGKDILLFDPEKIDTSGTSAMSGNSYTEKGDKVAVGVQSKGAEIQTFYIIDTKTGKILGEPIEGLRGFAWTNDEKHAYVWVQTQEMIDNQQPYKIYRHKIGTSRTQDEFLLTPMNAKNVASVYDARYGNVTFMSEGDFYATHSLKMKKIGSKDEPKEIYSNQKFRVSPYVLDDKMYVFTNHEAPNFKLMVASKDKPEFENWQDLYPEQETVLEDYSITPKYLIIQDKKDVVSRIKLYDLNGKFIKNIELPEVGNVSSVSYNRDVDAVFVGMTSFTTPYKLYKLNPNDLEKSDLKWELFYEQEVPMDMSNIESKIEFFTSKDGTKVPIFIIHKKGLKLDGTNPTLLYGYGGFNIGMSPSFIGSRAMFVNRGGVYAVACLRGGDEYGEKWHQDGMLFKKQNTFDDFIGAAEYLISENYTNTQKLAVQGGSNGGLLVGAVITQRPDLFKAAICAVPLLDMVRFQKFLIARYWIPEYGDPDKESEFQNILKYSPYHNIRMGINVPTTLVTAGENDTRVDPLHAKKFVAALQNNVGQKNPIMLYMDFDSGHGSGQSTKKSIDNLEFQMRFIMRELGM
jgi:prolyl oligopeptidase